MSQTTLTKQGFIKLSEELANIRFIHIPEAERIEDTNDARHFPVGEETEE